MSLTQVESFPKLPTMVSGRAYLEAALRVGPVFAEANQRIFQVQSEALSAAFSENSDHLRTLLATKDPAALLTEWNSIYQGNLSRAIQVTQTCFELLPKIQAELAKTLEASFSVYRDAAQQDVTSLMETVRKSTDAAETAMADSVAKIADSASSIVKKPAKAH